MGALMADHELDQEIGARIRRAREEAGLSQGELARRLGYASPATISYMEAGDRRITVTDLAAVAGALGLSLGYFLPVAATPPPDVHLSFRAEDIRSINPSARGTVVDFLLFVHKHGSNCVAPPDGLRRKKPGPAAELILTLAGPGEPPVVPREVARRLGIQVFDWAFGDDISGIFVCFEGKTAIGVNETHPVARQRFTVAHELGHHVYSDREAIVLDYFGRERGFSFDSSETAEAETKANQFAADLLMPAAWIRNDVAETTPDVRLLAKRYGVSEQAMWFRLLNLRLVSESDRRMV
jgi:Zn-dependent peptidase ImmA (M78 family)/transcriptional regulator with XRE-family HTH domain